ncbi:DoxX family protein [Cellulophaga sp. Ld12]|uniref:DoxX family protein n=2 Tax=unclassified Cellulophaga TaxID=2634405 RepID=UPI001C4FDE97|nr:DoxX family protein [Cellulophaga sp. HaHa_2_1]QXP53144.1 DoxX family protein [Cellulophaga sp. HaHa_2_1]
MNLLPLLIWFSSLAFLYFGFSCFYSDFIINEFVRYNLVRFRRTTGYLQLLGAMGLVIGLYLQPLVLFIAAIGLSVLMLAGFIVRLKIKDNFLQSSPSFFFAVLNSIIAFKTYTLYF